MKYFLKLFKTYLIGVLAVVLAGLNNPSSNKSKLKLALLPELGDMMVFNFYTNG
jgi:hypothetical protein